MENNRTCEIVQDLLPLYVDNVCAPASRELVREHLSQCGGCREMERRIRDTNIEKMVGNEAQSVLTNHAKRERGAAWKAGIIMGAILAFPILIVTIVTAAGQSDFTSLMILVSATMIAASFTVVPLMSKKNRFIRAIVSATAAILLTEFFGCLQADESFAMAAVPTIFGLSLLFFPFVVKAVELPKSLSQKKLLTVISWDCIWLFLTIIVGTLPERANAAFREGMIFSALLLVVVWSCYAVVKFSNTEVNPLTKASVIIITLGLWAAFLNEIIRLFLGGIGGYLRSMFDFSSWSISGVGATILLTLLSAAILFGAVYVIVDIIEKITEDAR